MMAATRGAHRRLDDIFTRLTAEYGTPRRHGPRDPLDELILTILSQNTNDRNRDTAWAALTAAYPTWDEAVAAGPSRIARAIRPGGLARIKSARIVRILRQIRDRYGAYSLDHLRSLPPGEVRDVLLSFTGVGPKTVACVLLFSLGIPAFPVDTHIHRVSLRLGLIPPGTSREKAHHLLESSIPPGLYYPFHINMIAHGRAACRAGRPACGACVLRDLCPYEKK